jgi:hypothetical protein
VFDAILKVWTAHERGIVPEQGRPRPVCPPHLQASRWKFLCECGVTWTETRDPVFLEGAWAPPVRPCVSCHGWVQGRALGP